MRHFRILGLLLVALGLAWAGPAGAQVPIDLFTTIGPDSTGGEPPPGVAAVFPVTIPLDTLATGPEQLQIELPDVPVTFVADLVVFEPRIGFDEVGSPLPGTTIDDLSFLWRGRGMGYDVLLTVVEGWIAGQIIGADGNYAISRTAGYVPTALALFSGTENLVRLTEPPVDEDFTIPPPLQGRVPTPDQLLEVYKDRLDPRVYAALKAGQPLPERIYIDVLAVFTDQARIDAGGEPGIPYDDRAIKAEILGGVDQTNTAFDNSLLNVELRVVQISRITGFTPTGFSEVDLEALKENATIQSLRDAVDADIVSVVIRNTGALVNNCGYAYVQRPGCTYPTPTEGCDVGWAFKPWAIHWTAQNCTQDYISLGHETGHTLGGEHDPEHLYGAITPEMASFAFSFGHSVNEPGAAFRTMMAIVTPPRILTYSNPLVLESGYSTGIDRERHNARTIEILAAIVSSFNSPRPELIFYDYFEHGDSLSWSSIEPSY